jgi:hypothetical protein
MKRSAPVEVDPHAISLGKLTPFANGESLDLDYYCSQEYTDIVQAAREMPAAIEWVNSLHQTMYEEKLNLETMLAEQRAKVFFDLRKGNFTEEYGGKPTEKALTYAIDLNDEVQDLERKLNVAKGWVKRLGGVQITLMTKLDLIRSSEATRRRLIEPVELEVDRANDRARRERDDNNDD